MGSNAFKNLKSIAIIIVLIAVGACGYYFYRISNNPTEEDLLNVTDLSALPATVCTIYFSSFEGASLGKIYIYDGKIREDATVVRGGENHVVHYVFSENENGTMDMWYDNVKDGAHFTDIFQYGGFSPVDGTVTCSPWWFPSKSAFLLPINVNFDNGAGVIIPS